MFGSKKSPLRGVGLHKQQQSLPDSSRSNPFDSDDDDELNDKPTLKTSKRNSSEPNLSVVGSGTNPFDDDDITGTSARNKYKNDFRDYGGLDNQSVQELENYAVYKAEETTKAVNGCLKIAEEIRDDATKTLVTLHHQGDQITRTHYTAANIDHDLSRVCMPFFIPFLTFLLVIVIYIL